jgi:hypothetical protein
VPSERKLDVAEIDSLVIAGWTGRNVEALEAHIRELEAIGVKRPKSVPIFYRVACSLLTTASAIEVMADKSSGEVECVLYALQDGLWLGVGSDHTDRKAETVGVTLSKQLCAKPVGATLWRYDEVKPHWDKLKLRSYVPDGARRRQTESRHRHVLRHFRGARRDFIFRHVRHGAGGPSAGPQAHAWLQDCVAAG